jgi:hypothetical protein
MVQGHLPESAAQFERVVQLQPKDQLSASFVKALTKAAEPAAEPAQLGPAPTPAAVAAAQPAAQPESAPPQEAPPAAEAASEDQAPPPPPAPPAALTGNWKAKPSPDVAIDLTLKDDGAFTWIVDTKGQKQTLEGTAGFKDGTLALLQAEGPPLVGAVTQPDPNSFEFRPPNAPATVPGLKFTR